VYKHAGETPILCAFNGTNFDFQILFYELRRHCGADDIPAFTKLRCVDPYVIAKAVIPNYEIRNYKQISVYEHLFGHQPEGQHTSMGDTDALDRIISHALFADALVDNVKVLRSLRKFVEA
jgi:hypothetical protein